MDTGKRRDLMEIVVELLKSDGFTEDEYTALIKLCLGALKRVEEAMHDET